MTKLSPCKIRVKIRGNGRQSQEIPTDTGCILGGLSKDLGPRTSGFQSDCSRSADPRTPSQRPHDTLPFESFVLSELEQ